MRRNRPITLTAHELRFDLAGWLREHATVVKAARVEWLLECPVCFEPKLAVHIARKAWQCWKCPFRGWSPAVLVAAVVGVSLADAHALILTGGMPGLDLGPVAALEQRAESPWRQAPAAPMPPGVIRGLAPTQESYLRGRDVPIEHAEAFGVGTILGDGSRSRADRLLSGRVFFPVWSLSGRLSFWAARCTGDEKPKMLNLPASCQEPMLHSADCTCAHEEWGLEPVPRCGTTTNSMMGLHLLGSGDRAILVEGPVDAVRVGPGAVCIFGSVLHIEQVNVLVSLGLSEVVVALDGDQAGRKGTPEAVALLCSHIETRVVWLPEGRDPGNLGREAVLRLADSAESADSLAPLAQPRISIPRVRQNASSRIEPLRAS